MGLRADELCKRQFPHLMSCNQREETVEKYTFLTV